ncbi:hypothetical protein GCM10010106_30240 [Thermopolyspora flexuosa]|jgi:hypothetical protein|uniref:Uncharacterized protein n=1 Tax=Thermopolyspora flexuosa TaxID=103836 RepID=A0A543ISC3_9ACTN|nr:hypothetical protein [Thermopolyspora flexuosa]TQM73485.1 hypothetical protein FHX40_0126 [Thermopolyspora flexuosa]GGM81555.1 hypothetical protein GCM10010106_30240 [Thermopolyspora flexuosa]
MATVTFRDETVLGKPLEEFTLPGLPTRITARELVRTRVREEVARYNAAPRPRFNGLVQPVEEEIERNGYRQAPRRRIDWERQADAAERAFLRNGFLLLVGDRQIEDLDEEIDLSGDPVVSFIKLVPLVGG